MGVYYETIPSNLAEWIPKQKVFWVATAPLSGEGHVNVSPKGGAEGRDTFGLLDERTFWYLDMSGSGNETISHLHEPGNGRITVMFNAFDGPPKIVRLWGKGNVLERGTKPFTDFVEAHGVSTPVGTRSIITVDVHQVGSSCGYSVPLFDFRQHRDVLLNHFAKKQDRYDAGNEEDSIERYWAYKNAWSMDNLPGMKRGQEVGRAENVAPIKKMVGPMAPPLPSYHKSQLPWPTSLSSDTNGMNLGSVLIIAAISFLLGISLATYLPLFHRALLPATSSWSI